MLAVRDAEGRVIAALATETAVIEHERVQRRTGVLRRALTRVRDLVAQGRLEGGETIGRLGLHDGMIIIDADGMIQYASSVAEGLYRQLGIVDVLAHTQLSELDTNEYLAFRAMETGVCLEQRIEEQDRLWIKKAIPLVVGESPGWASRLPGSLGRHPVGAIIVIQDVTAEVRKEQELKVKSAMIQEIHHRVKNNLQTITALLRLQSRRVESEEAATALKEAVGRIMSVAVVHEFLSLDEGSVINIQDVCKRIVQEFVTGTLDPMKQIDLKLEGEGQFLLPAQQATSCALIVNELIQNAIDHGLENKDEGPSSSGSCRRTTAWRLRSRTMGQGCRRTSTPLAGGSDSRSSGRSSGTTSRASSCSKMETEYERWCRFRAGDHHGITCLRHEEAS